MPLFERNTLFARRVIIMVFAILGLATVFIFQQTDIVYWFTQEKDQPNVHFAVNRAVRLLLNDIFMLIFIAALFQDRSVIRLALLIQLIDFAFLLPIYLIIKLLWEGDSEISSPLLSQFHRLIVNPTLMILLIPAVYFQRQMNRA